MHTHGRAGLRSQNAIDWPRPTTNVEERLLHSPEVVAGRAGRPDVHDSDRKRHQGKAQQNKVIVSSCLKNVSLLVELDLMALCTPGKHQSPARQTQKRSRQGRIGNTMFLRMLDGDRPYLGSFLSCIRNAADQEQSRSDNQQDKPHSELAHLVFPFLQSNAPNAQEAGRGRFLAQLGAVARCPAFIGGSGPNQA